MSGPTRGSIRDDWSRAFDDLKSPARSSPPAFPLTEHDPDSGLDAVRSGEIDAVQVIYNIFDQLPAKHLLPLCQEKNVGMLARVPLDEGSLTDSFGVEHRFPGRRFPRLVFPRRPQAQVVEHLEALSRISRAPISPRPPCASVSRIRRLERDPGHAHRPPRRIERRALDQPPLSAEVLENLRRHAWDRNFYV